MKQFLFAIILFTFCCWSCDIDDSSYKESYTTEEINTTMAVKGLFTIEDMLSDLKSVVLSAKDGNYLAEIHKIIDTGNEFLVLDRKSSKLQRFDYNGEFKGEIGKKGTAYDEVISKDDFVWSEKSKTISILSNRNMAVLNFSENGIFENKVNLDFAPIYLGLFQDDKLGFYNGYSPYHGANLLITDRNGKIVEKCFSFPKDIVEMHFEYTGTLHNVGKKVCYTDATSSSIYEVESNGKPIKLYQLNFGTDTYPEEEKHDFNKFIQASQNFDNPVSFLNPPYYFNDSVLVFKYFKNNKIMNGFYFKVPKALYLSSNFKNNFLFELFMSTPVVGLDSDSKFIFSVEFEKLTHLKSKYPTWHEDLKDDFPGLVDNISKISIESNQLLILADFKRL